MSEVESSRPTARSHRDIDSVRAEETMPKQGRRSSITNRFTDVLFQDTRGNGEQWEKRREAVRKVEYRKLLGKALLGTDLCDRQWHGIQGPSGDRIEAG